jgi:hypothetical protein
MRNKVLLIALTLVCALSAQAQISRLIGLTKTKYNGLGFTAVGDTISYKYTGSMDTTRKGALAWDSSYSMVYGTGYTTGNLSYRTYQTFSDTFNLATVRVQSYDTPSTSWVNYQYTTNTYDASNNLIQSILQVKDPTTGGWINNTNNMYTYSGSKEITRILQGWNTAISVPAWTNKEKDSFAYDGSSNMVYHLVQAWDTGALLWRNTNLYLATYNTMNQVTTTLHEVWPPGDTAWKNLTNTIYDYNSANLLSNTIVQRWDTGLLVWNNNTADSILYDASSNKSVETNMRWDTAAHAWANTVMNKYTYDANHNALTDTTLTWNNTSAMFVYNKLRLNSYNAYNQILVTTTESWSTTTSSWIYKLGGGGGPGGGSDIQWRYYYEIYPPVSIGVHDVTKTGNMAAYPMPASSLLNIKINWNEASAFTVTIVDMKGSIVRQWNEPATQAYSRTVPVNDLAPGNYIIKANGSNGQLVQQLVIE